MGATTLESYKTIELKIPLKLYDSLKELNINIEKEVNEALFKKVRCFNSEEKLKEGYLAMGKVNLGFAKMCLEADEDALKNKEHYLTECE